MCLTEKDVEDIGKIVADRKANSTPEESLRRLIDIGIIAKDGSGLAEPYKIPSESLAEQEKAN